MHKIIVLIAIGVPLTVAGIFIMYSVENETFPLFEEDTFDEKQSIQETYEAALEFCSNNYQFENIKDKEEYDNCINSVESWFLENSEN